ncbi:MAG: protein-glutamate O-methyltransferase CheR, partial [Chloroflexaceae bacterium]|nr:protein-glutamate O-methyltransferase CheR [Chloroflexaceae bacterium]
MGPAIPRPQRPATDLLFQEGHFETLRDILAGYSGVYLDQANQRVLASGVAARIREQGMSLTAYLTHISQPAGRDELHQLSELVLNHETVFFRNQPHMQALREVLLPQMHRRKPVGASLRLWSAGCSTGEEPYSLAITVLETLGRLLPRPVDIWATDLSHVALAKAREGVYRGRTLSNVTPGLCERYFEPRSESWAVTREVRSLVHFEQFNLLDPFPPRAHHLDIIFCQNVTIYFELATFRSLVDRFYHTLNEGGLLFLGFSETLWNIYDKFRLLEIGGAFVYVKDPAPQRVVPGVLAAVAQGRGHEKNNGSGNGKGSRTRKPSGPGQP